MKKSIQYILALTVLLFVCSGSLSAQISKIEGYLKFGPLKEVTPGATVLIKGLALGGTINTDGFYQISSVPTSDTVTVYVSVSGFNRNERTIIVLPGTNTVNFWIDAVTDIDSNSYSAIEIGSQVWMGENLRVKHYINGDSILTTYPAVMNISSDPAPKYQWSYKDALLELPAMIQPLITAGAGGLTIAQLVAGGYISASQGTVINNWANSLSVYNPTVKTIQTINDECLEMAVTISQSYGLLYTWHVVADSNKLCPSGWHVPTEMEWSRLASYLGGDSAAGGKLKEAGISHWSSPNTLATNESGFSGLPGGVRTAGSFGALSYNALFWSFTDSSSAWAYCWQLNNVDYNWWPRSEPKNYGGSVRCIKDTSMYRPTVIINTSDSGIGSLRYAIEYANSTVGVKDTITFNIVGTGPFTIRPLTPLPEITDPVVIDGFSQPGASAASSKLLIQIDGTYIDSLSCMLGINGASNCTIKGLVITRFSSYGIRISNSTSNVIAGNYIGALNDSSSLNTGTGIMIIGGGSNIIGGKNLAERNIISGNPDVGIWLAGSTNNNQIKGNFIGTDISGTKKIPNGFGIYISGVLNNIIGGTEPGEGNLISGNMGDGILFKGGDALHPAELNKIQGNFIGTDYSGLEPLGNIRDGILYFSSARNNLIGGTDHGSGNTIAFNGFAGVAFEPSLNPGTGNSILSNSIYSNAALGIDLNGDWVTSNDPGDADTGPNNLQNYPVLTSVSFSQGSVNITGNLNSKAGTAYTLQFFASKVADSTGFGEGGTLLGSKTVTTGADGNVSFNVTYTLKSSYGNVITATATDPQGNTSEFSKAIGGLQNQVITSGNWPFYYRVNRDGIPNILDNSDIAAVDSSFRTWTRIPTASIDFRSAGTTTAKYASATDSVNLVTFIDDQFPFTPGVLAVTAKTLKVDPTDQVARIIDADIVFNPAYVNDLQYKFGVGNQGVNGGYFDIQSVTTHEIGHILGLLHTGVRDATMFYMLGEGISTRTLKQDDKSWASYTYPKQPLYSSTYGAISGNIAYGYNNQPVAGTLVMAINTSTNDTVHAYSDALGNYLVPGVRPGSYYIYIEPLDGSLKVHRLKPGNISQYVYDNTIYTDYPGEFYNNNDSNIEPNDTKSLITVSAGTTTAGKNIITNKDVTPPKILTVSPASGAQNVAVLPDIIIRFSEPPDNKTLSKETTYLKSVDKSIGGSYTPMGDSTHIILFTPEEALNYSTTYTLHINTGVTDLKGNTLASEFQSTFKTLAKDTSPPSIVSVIPSNGADTVFITDPVKIIFSEPMNKSSVENGFALSWSESVASGPPVIHKVDGSFTWDNENGFMTFTPVQSLREGTTYTINLPGSITDLGGNASGSSKTCTFTTVSVANPVIIYLGPSTGQTNVTIKTPVVADFSEPIDTATVNSTTFRVLSGSTLVQGDFEFLNSDSRVIFRPKTDLNFNQAYKISVTAGIYDVSRPSQHLAQASLTTFTTAAKIGQPSIDNITPSSGVALIQVLISGSGFDPNPVNNKVDFNGIYATVESVTLSTLTVIAPLGVNSGPITVTVNGAASNPFFFHVIPQSLTPCDDVIANANSGSKSRDVTVTPDGAFAYVTNSGSGTVSKISMSTFSKVVDITVGENPLKIDLTPDGTRAYVTNFTSHTVSVIDLSKDKVSKTISVGINPYGIKVTPDGKRVYVANYTSNDISVIDADPNSGGYDRVVANVNTGTKNRDVGVSPDAGMVFVAGDNGLTIISSNPADINFNSVIANVSTGTKTKDVTIKADAAIAIVSTLDGNLMLIDIYPQSDFFGSVIANVSTGTKTGGVKVSGDAMFVYVTSNSDNNVLVYKIGYGSGGSTNGSSYSNLTLTLENTIPVGTAPEGLVIDNYNGRLLVVNSGSGTGLGSVSVIKICCGPVVPEKAIGDLIINIQNMIRNGKITKVRGYALIVILNRTLKDIYANRPKIAQADLNVFIALVNTYIKNKQITAALGNPLINSAQTIINQLKGIKSASIQDVTFNYDQPEIDFIPESKLSEIYPVPFSESLTVNYEIAINNEQCIKVLLRVYNINGEMVRTLIDNMMQAGRFSVEWNGNYDNGNPAPGGTYFVHFRTGNVETIRKIILIR